MPLDLEMRLRIHLVQSYDYLSDKAIMGFDRSMPMQRRMS